MQNTRSNRLWNCGAAFGLGLLASLGSLAQAQTPDAEQKSDRGAEAPVSSDPTMTTAVFGDWMLRCVKGAEAAPPVCEIVQSIVVEGQQAPIAQIALGRVEASKPMNLTVVLPNNVTLLSTPRLMLEDADKKPADLAWQRCVPAGCFSSMEAGEELLARWAKAPKPGKLVFVEGGGQPVALPFSLRGFTQALGALSKPGG